MLSPLLALLLGVTGTPDIPKDSDLYRFVPPGQEQAVLPGLFKHAIPDLSAINEIDSPYNGAGPSNFSYRISDPDDATKMRMLMFYGIKNAKEMALRKLVSQSRPTKIPENVSFQCLPYFPTGLRAAFTSKTMKQAQSGNWWFSCMATSMDT